MNDVVSHALVSRSREASGFTGMVGVSAIAHVALVALAVGIGAVMPAGVPEEREIMTISLGGPPGPRSGGMTPIGGRPVQQVAPPAPTLRSQPVRPPAEEPPAMTLPTKEAPRPAPKPQSTPPAKTASPEPTRSRTPTRGPETRAGSATVETGARGFGIGLSSGGGGTGGEISLSNFCCPDYLSTMVDLIQRNWNSKQQVAGTTTVRFTIHRNGSLSDVQVAKSSGYAVLDLTAQRAVAMARMPPLPAAYTNEVLTVHLNFEYQR